MSPGDTKDVCAPIKKILVLTTSYPNATDDWSGVFIHKLNVALTNIGYQIFVLAPSNGELYGFKTFNKITIKRFGYFWPRKFERLCSGAGGIPENLNRGILSKIQVVTMTTAFMFQSLIHSRDSDLIYANWLGAGLIGALTSLARGIPLVTSFRGDDGYLARSKLLWRICSKFVIARSSALAPVSNELAEICFELGASKNKVFTPRFGVDTTLFCPDSEKVSSSTQIRIVYAGSLIPKKGVQDLIEALAVETFENVILDVVGDGFYADDLRTLATNKGISHRVNWRGLATPAEVAQIMKSSDILCLPSHTEGSPNVVKEAMSCGLPVVATRVGGVPDLVQENLTGFLYNIGDIDDLTNKLLLLVANPDLRQSFGEKARERVLDFRMSWDDTAAEFHKMFQSISEQRRQEQS